MPGPDDNQPQEGLRRALRKHSADPLSGEQALRFMHLAIDVAEDLDELERKLDPHGPPPRHAAMAYQRLRRLKRTPRGKKKL